MTRRAKGNRGEERGRGKERRGGHRGRESWGRAEEGRQKMAAALGNL